MLTFLRTKKFRTETSVDNTVNDLRYETSLKIVLKAVTFLLSKTLELCC